MTFCWCLYSGLKPCMDKTSHTRSVSARVTLISRYLSAFDHCGHSLLLHQLLKELPGVNLLLEEPCPHLLSVPRVALAVAGVHPQRTVIIWATGTEIVCVWYTTDRVYSHPRSASIHLLAVCISSADSSGYSGSTCMLWISASICSVCGAVVWTCLNAFLMLKHSAGIVS